MAYFVRDDREAPGYRGFGKPIISQKSTVIRVPDEAFHFIHAAPTVMHDACVHANIPGVTHDASIEDPHARLNASFDARDAWVEQFGPGHALCWDRLWTTNPDRAPDCLFCGEPVLGRG